MWGGWDKAQSGMRHFARKVQEAKDAQDAEDQGGKGGKGGEAREGREAKVKSWEGKARVEGASLSEPWNRCLSNGKRAMKVSIPVSFRNPRRISLRAPNQRATGAPGREKLRGLALGYVDVDQKVVDLLHLVTCASSGQLALVAAVPAMSQRNHIKRSRCKG